VVLLEAVALATRGPERDTGRAMSQENVEAVQRALADFNAGKIGSNFESTFDPGIEFRDELGEIDSRDNLVTYLKGFQEALSGLHAEWEEVATSATLCCSWSISAAAAQEAAPMWSSGSPGSWCSVMAAVWAGISMRTTKRH